MRSRRMITGTLLLLTLLTGCGSNAVEEEAAAVTAETTVPPTTVDVRSRTVPVNPDAAYINAVLDELSHIRGDIRREVYGNLAMSQAVLDRVDDMYDEEHAPEVKQMWARNSMRTHEESIMPPGDEVYRVVKIYETTPTCLAFSADVDVTKIMKSPEQPKRRWFFHVDFYPGDNRTNITPWKFDDAFVFEPNEESQYSCQYSQ